MRHVFAYTQLGFLCMKYALYAVQILSVHILSVQISSVHRELHLFRFVWIFRGSPVVASEMCEIPRNSKNRKPIESAYATSY